jgi:crotonyl-CoA carboxylase/reductase
MTQIPEIVPVGTLPPLGIVPKKMYAQLVRPERYGEPKDAFKVEEIEIPSIADDEVLVAVMAAGVNYNNVWSALGYPVDVIAGAIIGIIFGWGVAFIYSKWERGSMQSI